MQVIFSLPPVFPISAANFNYVSRPPTCIASGTKTCLAYDVIAESCELDLHSMILMLALSCRPRLS